MTRLSGIVDTALYFYQLTVVIYILLSWFQGMGWALRLRQALAPVVEPFISPFRRIVPASGTVDFSPLVALLVLQFLVRPLIATLLRTVGL